MSVSNRGSGADEGSSSEPDPNECANAEEYVRDRLASADGPVTPSGLASEYDCSSGHMRRTLRDLTDAGDAVRVNRGEYVAADEFEDDETDVPGAEESIEQGAARDVPADIEDDLDVDEDESPDARPDERQEDPTLPTERTVTLDWIPEGDDPEKSLPVGVEVNSAMIDTINSDFWQLKNRVENLTERLNELEADVEDNHEFIRDESQWLYSMFAPVQAASDLETNVVCPECGSGEPEVKKPVFGDRRVECPDCDHVLAELE